MSLFPYDHTWLFSVFSRTANLIYYDNKQHKSFIGQSILVVVVYEDYKQKVVVSCVSPATSHKEGSQHNCNPHPAIFLDV